ncbi:MAG: hypothetical protein IRZ04_16600 [Rhodospirillales bacterium]|nr:hypothetical protein [Rhodospirillales bacterium]
MHSHAAVIEEPTAMTSEFREIDDDDSCPYCKKGRMIFRNEEITVSELTDRGEVVCQVVVPMGSCTVCNSRMMGSGGSEKVANALRRARDALR